MSDLPRSKTLLPMPDSIIPELQRVVVDTIVRVEELDARSSHQEDRCNIIVRHLETAMERLDAAFQRIEQLEADRARLHLGQASMVLGAPNYDPIAAPIHPDSDNEKGLKP